MSSLQTWLTYSDFGSDMVQSNDNDIESNDGVLNYRSEAEVAI